MFHNGVIKILEILFVFQVSIQKETSRAWCTDNDFRNSCSKIEHTTYLVLLLLWYGKIFIELFFTHIIKTLTFKRKKKLIFFIKLSSLNDPWNGDLVLQWWKKTYIQILKCSTKFYNNNNVMSCIFKVKNLLFRELVKIVLISRNF